MKTLNWIKSGLQRIKLAWLVWRAQRMAAKRVASVKRMFPGCEGAMNVVWPPSSGVTTGYTSAGTGSTIRWGTDGVTPTATGATSYYFCSRFAEKELTEVVKLPNGSGLTAGRVFLKDGIQWTVTVRDDTAMTPPAIGSSVAILDAGALLTSPGKTYAATVVDNDYEAAPKQPGERVLVIERLTIVDSGVTGVTAG